MPLQAQKYQLKRLISEVILPEKPVEIEHTWSGIMGLTKTKEPIIKQVEEDLYLLAGHGGMGVALAPYMAKELVGII